MMGTGWQGRTAAAVMVSSLLALGGPAPASAQVGPVSEAAKDDARRNYKAGEAKFQQGSYAAALGLYEQADAIVPIPLTKYKIAVCHDRLGQVSDAVRWYQIFLDTPGSEKRAAEVADAKARLASLPKPQGQVHITLTPPSPPQLTYSIDGGPAQPSPPSFTLPSGHHRLSIQAHGFNPAVAEVDVSPSQPKELRITLAPATGPTPTAVAVQGPVVVEETSPPPRGSLVPSFVLFGVAVVGAGVGTAFGVMALQDKTNFNAHPTLAGANKQQRDAVTSDVSFLTAVTLAAVGGGLLGRALSTPRREAAARGFVVPYAGPTGGGVVGGLSF